MEKNLEQLFEDVKNSEELAKELADLLQKGDREALEGWFKEHDCNATVDEAKQFIREKKEALMESGELTPEQLEMAAGGTAVTIGALTVVTAAIATFNVAYRKGCFGDNDDDDSAC